MCQPSGVGDARPLALVLRTRVPAERCLGGCGARKPTRLSCLLRADAAWEPWHTYCNRSGRETPELLHAKRHPKWGVATRPFNDLTAPLALGVAEVPARRCPRLSGRGSPRGFVEGYALSGRASACAQQPLSPCGRPVNRGAHPSPATGQGEKTRDAPYKKAPEMGAFLYGINEPSAWEICARKSLFPFFLRSAQANEEKIVIYWIEAFCERISTIRETVTSLVRGLAK